MPAGGEAEVPVPPRDAALASREETYLDSAGSAVETSKALRLHRTSLYYRLRRVESLTYTNLKDGGDRLMLHLSLKMARLHGPVTSPSSR
ncbi:MAG: helix-turn-helix domain-containing protein [Actinophytocola sp.]|uniref:helix-turn-helix domain-containing protein n=1 Tax=Actinophytocola sp. TaxID=1872138 RepID=UPI003C77C2E1